jgi:hypothetical protein
MSGKYNSLTVIFEHDMGEDDCRKVADAIAMLRGILCVTANVSDREAWVAEARARTDIANRVFQAIHGNGPGTIPVK